MKLYNKTNHLLVTDNLHVTQNLKQQMIGLIFADTKKAMLFHTRFGIHTFGMNFPIDIVVLNRDLIVVKIKSNLPPNQIFFWNPKFSTVIELPKGSIKKTKTTLGDRLSIHDY